MLRSQEHFRAVSDSFKRSRLPRSHENVGDDLGMILVCCWDDFGMIWGRIWNVFGMFLECVWHAFGMFWGCFRDVVGRFLECFRDVRSKHKKAHKHKHNNFFIFFKVCRAECFADALGQDPPRRFTFMLEVYQNGTFTFSPGEESQRGHSEVTVGSQWGHVNS